ncbi:pdhC [Scenedesmus sp. PABB004]|nr:pdhC [Scenedesmus sp. PABB004]
MSALRRGVPRLAGALAGWASRGGAWPAGAPGASSSSSGLGGSAAWRAGLVGWLQRGYADLPAHVELAMPSLSPTMTQGNIAAWRKAEGDSVAPGDILAEVETDKATIEWEAQEEGYIAKIIKPAGSKDIPVGTPVALIVEEAGDVAAFSSYTPGGAARGAPGRPRGPQAQQRGSRPRAAARARPRPTRRAARRAPAPAPAAAPAASSSAPAAPAAAPAAAPGGGLFPPHELMKMPALSPTMSAGNIVAWQKKVGDAVAPGDMLCEVETDKATITWEAQEEGYIAALLLPDGAKDIAVGTPAAVLVEEADAVPAFATFTPADAAGSAPSPKPATSAPPPPPPAAAAPPKAPTPAPSPALRAAAAPAAAGGRVVASPYAKKLAAQAGVSLAGAAGSGPGGRIVAADVQQLVASGGAAPAAAPGLGGAAAAAAAPAGGYTDVEVSQIKRVTAARLLESKLTIPHYYLTMECELDALLAARESLNVALAGRGKLSVNDFIVKAAALACRAVPAVNASWRGDVIRQFHNVDVNVAVASPAGLMVPFVRDADTKGLLAISQEVKALAAKAKEGRLSPAEFMGGTFTISNLGMFGVKQFAAIVNPPQAAILAVGAALPKVVSVGPDEFAEATVMHVTLSCDHRVIDGAVGAEWLKAFKQLIENPVLFAM